VLAREVLRDLDLLRDRVAAGDGGEARVERGVVDALAAAARVRVECVAGEPVVAVAGFTGAAVGVVAACLSVHFRAAQ